MAHLPTGTVTFLFSDIEGSTRLARAEGSRWPILLERHQALLREAFGQHGGVEVATEGDSFFVVFPSAPESVAGAADAQRAVSAEAWPDGIELRVRMGLHTGEGALGGDNYVGLDIHRAARIAGAAHGGQVLVSAATHELAARALPSDITLRDLGPQRLKDLPEPERVWQLVIAGLPSDFPPLRTISPTNLPPERTSFVGREREVAEIAALLEGSRVLTLTGPGGTGKTRLALRVGGDLRDGFHDGVFFVALEPLRDPGLFHSTVAHALGVAEQADRPLRDTLADHLRERDLLLVLDNFEQLMGAATMVAELLAGAPRLRVIVTSREPLRIAGEQEYPVPPMGLPDARALPDLARLSQFEAVALFIARARAVRPDFAVTNENAPAVAEIAARLEGLPLAIELAAARIKLLGPDAILARLGNRLDLLSSGAVDLSDRQRTLRGAIAWSFELLDEPERRLFSRLSIFAGGADLDAIEEVAGAAIAGEGLGGDAFDLLSELVDKSLVRPTEQPEGAGEPRFGMLETIREYAGERLAESGERDELTSRHAQHYLALAERAEPELTGNEQIAWLDRLDREIDNVRAALRWSIEQDEGNVGMALAGALWRYWHQRSHLAEGRDWLERLLTLPSSQPRGPSRFRALNGLGGVVYWQGDYATARQSYEESLAIAREIGDQRSTAEALFNLAYLDYRDGDFGAVDRHAGEARDLYQSLGDRAGAARAGNFIGLSMFRSGDYEGALRNTREARQIVMDLGKRFEAADMGGILALSLSRLGDHAGAYRVLVDTLDMFVTVGNLPSIAPILDLASVVELEHGDVERALRLIGASDAIRERAGGGLSSLDILRLENPRTSALRTVPAEEVERLTAEGRAMSFEQALAYARQGLRATAS
jgi:predicted ATPase/class 3 adenylate cyclase